MKAEFLGPDAWHAVRPYPWARNLLKSHGLRLAATAAAAALVTLVAVKKK